MNYERYPDDMKECTCASEPVGSLTDLMTKTSAIAADVLAMSRKLHCHLFGVGNPCCETEDGPKCFMDDLKKTQSELLATAEELSMICAKLGA